MINEKIRVVVVGLVLLIFSSEFLLAQNDLFDGNYDTTKKVLILLHPTVKNIKNFLWLTENEIISLDNSEFMGLFFESESYNYNQSVSYLLNDSIENYHLQKIGGLLTADSVFTVNSLSKQFLKVLQLSNGMLFFGGPDIPPALYNEKTNLLTEITDPQRNYFEVSLLFHYVGGSQNSEFVPYLVQKPKYMIWAFCLGMQTMNVAAGGSLVQDIPSQLYGITNSEDVLSLDRNLQHKNYEKTLTFQSNLTGASLHRINLTNGQFFINQMNYDTLDKPLVYSYHHQCVNKLSYNYVVIATSTDNKIVEAIKHKKFQNVIGFQFHPEKSVLYNNSIKYQFSLGDTVKYSYTEKLNDGLSDEFNRDIWGYFSSKYNSLKK